MATDDAEAGESQAPLEIHPRLLRPATFPPFGIYVRKPGNGKLLRFRKADEPVYANTWDRLEAHGFATVHVRGEDRELFYDYLEENLSAILCAGQAPAAAIAPWAYRLTCRGMEDMLAGPDSFRRYERVKELVSALVQVIRRQPGVEWTMVERGPLRYHTHVHSVNVCAMLAGLAARSLGVEDAGLLTEIALGAVLHDIGKALVPLEILEKPGALTRQEFARIKKHPREGLSIARPFLRRSPTAESIIFQHHENACGGGYPEGRSGESINVFARAARIVDVFDAITSNRPYGRAVDEYSALNTMVSEMRGQFDMAVLRKFIRYVGAQCEAPAPEVTAGAPAKEPEPQETVHLAQAAPAAPDEEECTSFLVQAVLEDAGLAGDAAAAPAAEETQDLTVRPIIRLEPVEAPEPAGPATAEAEPVLGPSARERLQAIGELAEARAGDTALMSGLVGAIRHALCGPLGEAARAASAPPAESAAVRSARETEESFVRALFPLVWQVDEWIGRFNPLPRQAAETAAACADARSCLRALREDIVAVLEAHNCEVIEREGSPGPERVGFNYCGRPADEPEAPAPVVFYPEPPKRKAG